MEVRLWIHAEPAESGLTWWIESPDIPGFSGTGEDLVDARVRSELAIQELLRDRGVDEAVSFAYELVAPETPSEGLRVERTGEAREGVDNAGSAIPVATAA
jgi:hypothetical protein